MQEGNWIEDDTTHELFLLDYEYSRFDHRACDTGNLLCEHTFDYSLPVAPGFTFDVGAYPSVEWQRAFFTAYLEAGEQGAASTAPTSTAAAAAAAPTPAGAAAAGAAHDETWRRTTAHAATLATQFPSAAATLQLAREARVGILSSHLYWSLWSAVMGAGRAGISTVAAAVAIPEGEGAAAAAASSSGTDEEGGGGGTSRSESPLVVSGHSVFDYVAYGLVRSAEYLRLKAQLQADGGGGLDA